MAIFKLQSAMEYLMTYGWALLIISVVIIALVSIGVFNGSLLGNQCTATSGFTCDIQSYSASSGNLLVTIGQDTGTPWVTANIIFVNTTSASNAQSGVFTPQMLETSNTLVNGLPSETQVQVSVPIAAPSTVRIGSGITGTLWAQYTVGGGSGSLNEVEIATISAKATS